MTIDRETLLDLTERAKLIMDDAELDVVSDNIKNMLKWLASLRELKVDRGDIFCHYGLNKLRLRDDEVTCEQRNCKLYSLSSKHEQGLIIVPPVIKK